MVESHAQLLFLGTWLVMAAIIYRMNKMNSGTYKYIYKSFESFKNSLDEIEKISQTNKVTEYKNIAVTRELLQAMDDIAFLKNQVAILNEKVKK